MNLTYPHANARIKAVLVDLGMIPLLFSPHGPISILEGVPEDAEFFGMQLASEDGIYAFLFSHPDWPLVQACHPIPEILVVFQDEHHYAGQANVPKPGYPAPEIDAITAHVAAALAAPAPYASPPPMKAGWEKV